MKTQSQTYTNTYNNNKEGFYAGFLFLVWPFLATLSAFKNYHKNWAKNVFWAFCAFYGYTFAIGTESTGTDILWYLQDYQSLHGIQLTFSQIVQSFQESGKIDVLQTIISIVLSRFTDSPTALTMVYGIIFGYFLSRNLWFLLERLEGKIAPITFLLLICFFMINPIWNLNGFRMWTAAHIFIFGLLPYLFDGKKNGLWIASLSILVHFSFIVPVGTLIIYLIFGNRLTVYFGFYLFTLFMSELDITAFNQFMEAYAPEILQDRTAGYRNEESIERRETTTDTRNWYAIWYGRALTYSVMGFLIILYVKGRGFIRENVGWHSLFSFTLLFYGIANILSFLPSGGRFTTIANLCAIALISLYIQNRPSEKFMSRFVWIAVPALLLYILVELRVALISLSATSIIGNPIIAYLLSGDNLSLNDIMRMLF